MKQVMDFMKKNWLELLIMNAITITFIAAAIMMSAISDPESAQRMSQRTAGEWIKLSALMTGPVLLMNIFYWMKRGSF